jgi:hypothetical protein
MAFADCKVKIVQVPVTEDVAKEVKKYIKKEKEAGNPKFAYKVYSDFVSTGLKKANSKKK